MSGVDVLAMLDSAAAGCGDPKCEACVEIARARSALADLIEKGDALMTAFRNLDKERGVAAALAFDAALQAVKGGKS